LPRHAIVPGSERRRRKRKKKAKPRKDLGPREIDESLGGKTVTVDKRTTKLELALLSLDPVTIKDLEEGLRKLDLSKVTEELSALLGRSLFTKSVSVDDVVKVCLMELDEAAPAVLLSIFKVAKNKMGERGLTEAVRDAEVDLLDAIAEGVEGEALDKFLTEHGLLCIKRLPDISEEVEKALADGTAAADIVKLIADKVDAELSVVQLLSVATAGVFGMVFADKAAINAEALSKYAPLLERIVRQPTDEQAEVSLIFAAQQAWYEAGKDKVFAKELFPQLLELNLATPEAFITWRDDTQNRKTKGKMDMLLKINSWITEIEPREEYDEGDEGDEEEEDEYLTNPNSEYF